MDILAYLAIAVIAYLLGSISTGMLVSKAMGGPDLHKVGSGNTGATNALRTMGKKGGAIVFAGDVVKALLAWEVLFGILVTATNWGNWLVIAWVWVIAGLCIYRHHANIGRLIHGTERKIGQKA